MTPMASPTGPLHDGALRTHSRAVFGTRLSLCIGVALALGANAACAAALGSLATSVGVLGALAALFVLEGLPAHLSASALSTAAPALLIAAGAFWLWRARGVGRVTALADGPSQPATVQSFARPSAAPEVVLPKGFQREALLAELRQHFVQLQDAWDHAEMNALRALTTPEMLEELCLELPGSTGGVRGDCTEVVTLRAELLGFESLAQVFMISVEFSGLIRESAETGAVPFRELWLLTRSRQPYGTWQLARHQALI